MGFVIKMVKNLPQKNASMAEIREEMIIFYLMWLEKNVMVILHQMKLNGNDKLLKDMGKELKISQIIENI